MDNVFTLAAKLTLDSSAYDQGLNNARDSGSKLGSALGTAFSAGTAAVAAATTAITAFAGASVHTGMAFDSSMSQVAATMGFTVDELNTAGSEAFSTFEQLSEFAQQMGSTTAFSASQAADALNFMALAGYDADTAMKMLPNVLNLAAAGGIELAAASDMVTDAQSALGLSLDETAYLVDKMAKASSKSNTSVEQLGSAILTIGGTAKSMAGGTTELAAALGILADNGIKGAEGGTALRNVLLGIQSDKFEKSFGELGVEAYDAGGNLRELSDILVDMNAVMADMTDAEKTDIINKAFNRQDLKSVNALLATSVGRWDELESAIDGAWYTIDGFNKGLDAIGYNLNFDTFSANFEAIGVSADTVSNALAASGGSADAFADYLWESADAGTTFEDVLDAIPMDLDELQMAFDATSGAAQAMADVQLDNLAGDITLFQSALEGAKIAVSDGLTPSLREFVQFGSTALSTLTEAYKEGGVGGAMEAFGIILADGLAMITSFLPDVINAGIELLQALMKGISDNLDLLTDTALKVTMSLVQFLLDNLPDIIKTGLDILIALAKGIAENLDELVPTVVDVVLEIVDVLTDPETLGNLVDAAIAIIIALAQGLIDSLPKLAEKAPEIVEHLVQALVENAPKLLAASLELIVTLVKGLIENLPQIFEAGGKIVAEIVSGIFNVITDLWNVGKDAVNKIWEGFTSLDAGSWGKDLISNFVGGITSKWEDLKSSVRGVAQTVKDILGFSEPKEGPLSDFHTYAPDMMALFAQGIRDNEKLIRDQIESSFDFGDMTIGTADIDTVSEQKRVAVAQPMYNADDLATAIREALAGSGVYMDGRLVGQLVTNYQRSNARAVGA